jgi:hypothetical protein
MAARRSELGEPPTPEELLAYRDGELTGEARARIEEKIAAFPDAARALVDLAAFPEVRPAPGTREPTDEEVRASWEEFRRRRLTPSVTEAWAAERRAEPTLPESVRRPSWLRLAAAAALAVAAGGLGWAIGRFGPPPTDRAAINVAIVELAPVEVGGERAGRAGGAITIGPGSEGLVLVLSALEVPGQPSYSAEILDEAGRRVWHRSGLVVMEFGTFRLTFDRGVLGPGRYTVRLLGRSGDREALLATYTLTLLEGR